MSNEPDRRGKSRLASAFLVWRQRQEAMRVAQASGATAEDLKAMHDAMIVEMREAIDAGSVVEVGPIPTVIDWERIYKG